MLILEYNYTIKFSTLEFSVSTYCNRNEKFKSFSKQVFFNVWLIDFCSIDSNFQQCPKAMKVIVNGKNFTDENSQPTTA